MGWVAHQGEKRHLAPRKTAQTRRNLRKYRFKSKIRRKKTPGLRHRLGPERAPPIRERARRCRRDFWRAHAGIGRERRVGGVWSCAWLARGSLTTTCASLCYLPSAKGVPTTVVPDHRGRIIAQRSAEESFRAVSVANLTCVSPHVCFRLFFTVQ